MLLKKQTVWLLTMLSLVVVLSVYYITSPDITTENVAFDQESAEVEKETAADEKVNEEAAKEDGVDVTVEEAEDGSLISAVSSDELFTELRMQIEDYRSQVRSDLQARVASKDVSAEEKSKAYEEMRELQEVSAKETFLEMLIKGKGYEDALVRADGSEVKITVKAEENSKTAANEIIRLVRSEMEDLQNVVVTFDSK
ncbi:SpoIIIAH-like family protein [Litchfieldia salsa]|uniref:Stage III sporulation protein AH n=1 Tax=Litchfieldia salsa TaxID=930152 RepID=A0A1H0WIH2_9BACI|nr:SpoIIIAH-like family protein [Litchfieldia salsa]SDP90524.1 stage III sporulation protein AH [Litchfieldia salsa]